MSFTEFVKKANVVTCDGPWGFGHWRIVDALENVLNTDHSLILAPPGAGVPLLAGTLFPAWLMLEKGKRSVLVVCADERVANLRRMFTAHDFPTLIPYMEHDAGAMRHATPRLCFVGPNAHLTGSGFDAIILDGTPDVNGGIPDFRYDAFASRRYAGGCLVTITCRQGRNDLASHAMSVGATTVAFPSHMFPDIPDHIDRTSGYFFWRYDQGLPIGGMRVAYEPETGASMFKRFLTMLLTPAMESRLQLLFGGLYSAKLTGTQINAEKVIVHVGAGVNGKTTLFTSLGKVLPVVALCGDVVHDSALLNASLCALWESADKIDDAWLKAAAASVAQVHVTTNRLPMCSDDASARRIEVIKWEQYIPERLRDPDMAQKIASDPNFLIWLAEGLRRYQAGER